MKCKHCNGKGRILEPFGNRTIPAGCPICGGTGEINASTNEEWFCGLSTEEKAEWLAENKDDNLCFICKAHCNPDNGCPMSARDIWYAWLKEKHNE